MTDDVSKIGAPGLTVDVEGDDVDIGRDCVRDGDVDCPATGLGRGLSFTDGSEGLAAVNWSGFCCVWILVFTTSSGQVITPAIPPAVVAVKISNPKPMSRLPTQSFAYFCSCS